MRLQRLEHRFVATMPDRLEPGILYICMEYGTAVHSCCCGCGAEVVTPFTPTDWKMTFDGESVSLWPSVGNWNLPCRSHYFIDRGRVRGAGPWSDAQVAAERQRDKAAKASYYDSLQPPELVVPSPEAVKPSKQPLSWPTRLSKWLFRN
jgi:hypothetical protein